MQIKDRVKLIADATCQGLEPNTPYVVTAIVADTDDKGVYWLNLEGFEDKPFMESLFEVIPQEPPTPAEDVHAKLLHWRDEWIKAQNEDNHSEAEKCRNYIDFYLDKMLDMRKAAAQHQQPEQ